MVAIEFDPSAASPRGVRLRTTSWSRVQSRQTAAVLIVIRWVTCLARPFVFSRSVDAAESDSLATRSTLSATVPNFSWKTIFSSFLACSSSGTFKSVS